MVSSPVWTELYRCDDPVRARTLATCLESMEFASRVTPVGNAFAVAVPDRDWEALLEILDEILAEQDDFDDFLDGWHGRSTDTRRKTVLALVVIVGTLAAIGLIRL